jgi:hypothetical protein
MRDIKHVAVIVKSEKHIAEGTRSALGLAVENYFVHLFILDQEIALTDAYKDSVEWLVDLEARYYSNNRVNEKRYGFTYLDLDGIQEKLKGMDLIIPFG